MRCFGYILGILSLYCYFSVEAWDPKTDECTDIPGIQKCLPLELSSGPHDASKDASELHEAMNSTLRKALIEIITKRNLAQRLEILKAYNVQYKEDLLNELKAKLDGKFRNFIVGMMMPLADFYAREIHNAIAGLKIKYGTLIEILGSLSNKGIRAVTLRYKEMYGKPLRKVFSSIYFDSEYYKELCISLTLGKRDANVNERVAKEDGADLYDAGEGEWDAATYEFIFANRSFFHIQKVLEVYKLKTPNPFENTLKKGFIKSFARAIQTMIDITYNRDYFFARRLKEDLARRLVPDHKILTRIIVGRSEIDLDGILKAFQASYNNENIIESIKNASGVYGFYKDALMHFLEGEMVN